MCIASAHRRSAALALTVLVVLASCTTGGNGDGDPIGPPGSVAIAASPSAVAIVAGGAAGTAALTITRTAPFSGAVDVDVSNVPVGMTASATPATGITGTSATLSVQASATVAPATYPLIITASGEGISKSADTIDVAVSAPVSTGVAVPFCAPNAPIWVAQQDGSGAWTRVLPTTGSTYHINFTTGRGGLAIVETLNTTTVLDVMYLTVDELTAYASAVNVGRCGTKTIFVPYRELGGLTTYRASLGYAAASGSGGTITIPRVAPGPQVLIALNQGFENRPGTLVMRRNVNIADGGTAPLVDFLGSESFRPDTAVMTVTGMNENETGTGAVYFVGSQGSARSGVHSLRDHARVTSYAGLPLSRLNAGELQLFETSVLSSDQRSRRTVSRYFRAVAPTSAVIGPGLPTPTISRIETGAFARGRATFSSQPDYNRWAHASFTNRGRVTSVLVTAAFLGGALPATWELQMPDLSAASGWSDAWAIGMTGELSWAISAAGGSHLRTPTVPADGARGVHATRSIGTLSTNLGVLAYLHARLLIP